jgi:hypothetical protein
MLNLSFNSWNGLWHTSVHSNLQSFKRFPKLVIRPCECIAEFIHQIAVFLDLLLYQLRLHLYLSNLPIFCLHIHILPIRLRHMCLLIFVSIPIWRHIRIIFNILTRHYPRIRGLEKQRFLQPCSLNNSLLILISLSSKSWMTFGLSLSWRITFLFSNSLVALLAILATLFKSKRLGPSSEEYASWP